MNAEQLSSLISKLGSKEQSGLFGVSDTPLVRDKAYADSEKYFYSPEPGLEIVFFEESETFCSLNFSVNSRLPDGQPYKGELPLSLHTSMSRQDVVKVMGTPTKSTGPHDTPMVGPSGGWDRFKLSTLPNVHAIIGYMPDLQISSIRFTTDAQT